MADIKQRDPETLTEEELSHALKLADILEPWFKSVRKYCYEKALTGNKFTGYKLVQKQARESFTDDGLFGIEEIYRDSPTEWEDLFTRKVKTPKQIRELLGKSGWDNEEISEFMDSRTQKVSSGYTLVAETDKRDEVDLSPESAFKNV